jgi:octaprenyl-diphosphate synthase
MAGFLLVVFTASELHDFDLLRTAMSLDGRGDLATCYKRGANIDFVTIGDHQNLVDFDGSTFFGIQFFNATQIAFGNSVLLSTCTDYSVHGVFSKSLTEKARILTVMPACGKHLRLYIGVFCPPCLTITACTHRIRTLFTNPLHPVSETLLNTEEINTLCHEDMAEVNRVIRRRLQSDVALVNQLGHYIIDSGGKRFRPLLVLLSARAHGYQGRLHHILAAIIEFIHTATLLHDDVVDESSLRRGKETANELFGNAASVLVGDFLYSRAFEMMVDVDSMRVMAILANTTNVIAEGEVMQLMNVHDANTTEERYIDVIHCKTAKLFEAATRLGAVLCNRDEQQELAMARYGMHLGTAFQLIDDVLDYTSSSDDMGKNVGDDLAEGKPTLPLIHAMRQGTAEQAALIRTAIEKGGYDHIDDVQAIIHSTGALDYTASVAAKEADLAMNELGHLEGSDYKQALVSLAHHSIDRSS